ncbi:MAG TPA: sugar-binding domain-containing protein [Candidatus Limiplasma sp.]|nr:sugar-binding domain-containing protein [Candidatus Limiplasma sp.]
MQDDTFALMQKIAPDLAEQMEHRALVLERIDALQPVGRRMLAGRLNLPEREVRSIAAVLKENGLVELGAAGMALTPQADSILATARRFSRELRGLTKMETALSKLLQVPRVYVAAGDADQDPHVLHEVARLCASKLRSFLRSGATLAVTGGQTMLEVAHTLPHGTAMNVMVVPARGGIGRALETQANTVASEIAGRLGGHHRLMHLPDDVDDAAMTELRKLSEVTETLELLQRADVVLYGIGRADDMGHKRQLSNELLDGVLQKGALAEAYGCYFNADGDVVYSASSVSRDLGKLKPDCAMIAIAAGARKADAIRAVMNSRPHAMLVTDEGAARALLTKH